MGVGGTVALGGLFLLLRWASPAAAAELAAALAVCVVGPHYFATYCRAYGSRDVVRAHPLVTLLAPPLLALAAWGALRSPDRLAPFYLLAYVVWSGYHYSGQSLGIAMLFPLRQGARLDLREKHLLALPLHASWIVSLVGLAHRDGPARNPAYGYVLEAFPSVRVPGWLLAAALVLMAASFVSVGVLARERRLRGVPLPAASVGVVAAQVIWFAAGVFDPIFNLVLVPVLHGLQYLALTGWHRCRAAPAERRLRTFGIYLGVVALGGLVIHPGLGTAAGAVGADPVLAVAVVFSFVNLHHFLLDGRIWRLREQPVARSFMIGA